MEISPQLQAAIAAHRFGLGEASLDSVGCNAVQWLTAQIGPADTALGDGVLDTRAALQHVAAERAAKRVAKNPPPGMTAEHVLAGQALPYREVIAADARSRLLTATRTTRPFAERLQLFWANHYTVSRAKGSTRGLVGASSATRSARTSPARSRRCCWPRPRSLPRSERFIDSTKARLRMPSSAPTSQRGQGRTARPWPELTRRFRLWRAPPRRQVFAPSFKKLVSISGSKSGRIRPQ